MRFLIKFSYDGTNYSGFQKQKGKPSIEEEMEKALTTVNNHKKTTITATGRTDKGVHALAQYGHTDIEVDITEKKLKRALNTFLPDDIHVIETKIVDNNFHARYNVLEKTYEYRMNLGEYNPIERNHVFQYNYPLDIKKMQEAIKVFEGKHDFRAFVTENKEKNNCIRNITCGRIKSNREEIVFTFTGDGFLRYQVRNMVGLLIRVGEGKLTSTDVQQILDSKDRSKSGKTAPPEGLYLVDVKYKEGEYTCQS